jgi:hypothetical protein
VRAQAQTPSSGSLENSPNDQASCARLSSRLIASLSAQALSRLKSLSRRFSQTFLLILQVNPRPSRTTRSGEGKQEIKPLVEYERFGHPDIGVGTSYLQGSSHQLGTLAVEDVFSGYKDFLALFGALLDNMARDRQKNRESFSGLVRGVSNPPKSSKILIFLFQSRLVCSLFLHRPSSWNAGISEVGEWHRRAEYSKRFDGAAHQTPFHVRCRCLLAVVGDPHRDGHGSASPP